MVAIIKAMSNRSLQESNLINKRIKMFNTRVQLTNLLYSLNTLLFVQHDDLLVVRKNDRPYMYAGAILVPSFRGLLLGAPGIMTPVW